MTDPQAIFDRRALRRQRTRAAPLADAHDFLLERAADDLVTRLAGVNRPFALALDLGAHTGRLGQWLDDLPAVGRVIGTESVEALATRLRPPRVVCEEDALPFASGTFHLVASALSLHWVNDLPGALVQIRRILRPDGLLLAALLGGETLTELRTSLMLAETETAGGAAPRVAPFAEVRDLGGLLQRAGFALPVADRDVVSVTYPDPLSLMAELRAMGAANALVERSRRPLGQQTLRRACEIYSERFGTPRGRIPATFEIITLTGWAPHESQQQPLRPGSAKARLADALGAREQPAGEKAPGGPPRPVAPASGPKTNDGSG